MQNTLLKSKSLYVFNIGLFELRGDLEAYVGHFIYEVVSEGFQIGYFNTFEPSGVRLTS